MGEAFGDLGAFRFISWKEDERVGIATAKPRDETAGTENDLSVGGAGEDARGEFRVFGFNWQIGPFEGAAVRIGWVGGG
jgi:hypothetical protein